VAPEHYGRARELVSQLRYNIRQWDTPGKEQIREALTAQGDTHRDVIARAKALCRQIHAVATEQHHEGNDQRARIHRGIPARWPQICAAVPEAMLAYANLPTQAISEDLRTERRLAMTPVVEELVASARYTFQQDGDLTKEKVDRVVAMAEEAVAMALQYQLGTAPAFDLLNQVAAAAE